MGIHSIIWDVGGVIVRTEDLTQRDQLAARYGLSHQEINDLVFGSEENYQAQLGEISHTEHWAAIRERLGLSEEERHDFEAEFFAGDVVDNELVDYIRGLKANYCTAILSNALSNLRGKLTDEWQIDDAFHHMVISAEVGLMKPDPAIYQLAVEQTGFAPEESIFIDDTPRNIEAAQAAGLHGIVFQNAAQAKAGLNKYLNQK
jgi:putative hydrolase of the HAD superfamily